jgi:hypothetical protein
MKYQRNDTQLKDAKRVEQQEKKPYEKPQLGRVTLFADQVLGVCRQLMTCPVVDSSRS